jgi:hypothetical protein
MKTISYKLGDLCNGDFASYDTEPEALEALKEAIAEGTLANIEVIGEEGCPWQSEEDARGAASSFFYVRKDTISYDEDGDVEWENSEILS